jgi:type II secretory pathway component GspD/PulD (secretin)
LTRLLVGLAVIAALALVPVTPAATQTESVRITQVSVKPFGELLQIAVVGSGPLTYRTLQLTSPPRLVVDLPGTVLDETVPPLIEVNRGGIARVRVGQFQTRPAIVRMAIDMDKAVPFTVATSSPGVVVARFTTGPTTAMAPPVFPAPAPAAPAVQAQAPVQPPAQPVQAPAQIAQAPATPPSRISLEFRNTELADVLSALAKVCLVNIVTDSSVKGAITLRLVDLTCDEALRYILEANNLGFRRLGRNLLILPADRLAPPPEVPESVTYPLGFGTAREIAEAVRAAVPGIRITFDARTNALVVVGTAAQHEEVRKILAGLDVQLVQIMIESRVVDVQLSDLKNLGLDWGLTATPIISIQGTFPNQIQIGVATTTINALLDALVTQRKARVISAPRIAVVDGNEAEVNLGEEFPIPSIDASGRLTFTFKPIGVILRIQPKANRDGLITTKITPEVTSVLELLQSPSGDVPRLATRRATTIVTARSGEPIVIAGLISSEERRTVLKVPLLGDIPIIGQLFRSTTTNRIETEVIFVVTAQIVPAAGMPAPATTPRP